MRAETISGSGKNRRGINHAEIALEEAKFWAEELQKAEFKGLGDTREAARYRVATKTGVAESYLKRLRYKWREMGEVAGSQYRALMLAYDEMCRSNEAAAAEHRADRLELRAERHAAYQERGETRLGMGAARN